MLLISIRPVIAAAGWVEQQVRNLLTFPPTPEELNSYSEALLSLDSEELSSFVRVYFIFLFLFIRSIESHNERIFSARSHE